MNAKVRKMGEIKVGDRASFEREITESDIDRFAEISGDCNPLHLENEYASQNAFRGRIVHGMFLGALISRLVGMELPGKKALLLKECLEFKKPAYIGDTLVVEGTVIHKSETSQVLEIRVEIFKIPELLVSGTVHVKVL